MPDLHSHAHPLTGASSDYAALLDAVGDARFVLIGEASHGTHEFYRERARLTQFLIEAKGFSAVAVEADWPDAYRVHRFVRGLNGDNTAEEALGDFQRFPKWMWRNTDVQAFVEWLRGHNERTSQAKVGFFGLDLYSLHRSMDAVVAYLQGVDPDAAERARERYACFDPFGLNPQAYGYATEAGAAEPCEEQAVEQLVDLQRRAPELVRDGLLDEDEYFYAEQNARLALNAESYYRSMFQRQETSWNIRDTHMAQTLEALDEHLTGQGQQARIVVWAHNSHLGDARGSAMSWERDELNLGQLTRQRWPESTFIIGQTTYSGTVFASNDWGSPGQVKAVKPGLNASVEAQLHQVDLPTYWLDMRSPQVYGALNTKQLQRFIGVIYRPQTERWSHYVMTSPAAMYDALLHVDTTRALTPLDADTAPDDAEEDVPETYPTGEYPTGE
ncbi:erythromycin esterase family protein [Deinococcus sp. QL22]|uniref:erythromycin esterase family protein n=1 Tax=Deinococcus sp. QL22 TaxID=2939437 RepID=UPI002017582E|nr:erythromycin esterase family protein [Deinococcus sp. QL22]UQN09093.1 erythromycin esterase family protein [Deinococcus sp. QL22]